LELIVHEEQGKEIKQGKLQVGTISVFVVPRADTESRHLFKSPLLFLIAREDPQEG